MNWFRKFMTGRYGPDHLSAGLLFLSLLLSVILMFVPVSWLGYIVYIPLLLCLYRMFSKNLYRRRAENEKFLKFWNPVAAWAGKKMYRIRDSKVHKYFKCPQCKQEVRVPKGKGKISITCPKCRTEFIRKS
jgi:hypothetical protein